MSCSLDRTKIDMIKKDIIDNNNVLKDKSATGVNRLKEYALNLYNFSIKKFGDIGSKPFVEPFTNKIQFNQAFFNKVDKINEEKEKDRLLKQNQKEDLQKVIKEELKLGITKEGDSNTNIEELYQKAMNLSGERIEEKLKQCE